MAQNLLFPSLICANLGPVSHRLIWVHGEWDSSIWKVIYSWILLQPFMVMMLKAIIPSFTIFGAIASISILQTSYFVSLFASIAIYRVFYHPLRNFPGPLWINLSILWKMAVIARGKRQHFDIINDLHHQYGEIVRTGPRLLSINNVEAIGPIYGPNPKCGKSAMYEQNVHNGMQQIRNFEKHQQRRKLWDKNLSPSACAGYTPRFERLTGTLISKFASYDGSPVLINDWVHYFTLDAMGDVAFSTSLGQMESGQEHPAAKLITAMMKFLLYGQNIPWLTNVVSRLPGSISALVPMLDFSESALRAREKIDPAVPDAMTHILHAKDKGVKLTDKDLVGDAMLFLLAGSDTSYSAIIHALFYLAQEKEVQSKLRAEIEPILPSATSSIDWLELSKLSLLNGVIHETLRLHPPVPAAQTRETPPEGLVIDGTFIPPETMVGVPTFTIQRDERYFVRGKEWLPERWLDGSNMIKDRRAYIPFSMGPFNCAGKYLAIMEQKILIAKLVSAFEIRLAEGEDGYKLFHQYRDYITMWLDEVRLCFIPK